MTAKRLILAGAVLGSGIVFLDSIVVNVALPRIGNTPTDASLLVVVRDASTSSFHLAMLVGAALLLVGAVNGVAIRNSAARRTSDPEPIQDVPVAVEPGSA
ncbi:MAG: hypothetical protein ACREOY_10840 [Candidatus Dormibacteraceae bacterium]